MPSSPNAQATASKESPVRIDQPILDLMHKKHPTRGNKVSLVRIDVNNTESSFHCMKYLAIEFDRRSTVRSGASGTDSVAIAFGGIWPGAIYNLLRRPAL